MTAELARTLLEPDDYFDVEVVDLLAVENTVGGYGGSVVAVEEMRAVRKVADDAGVPIHLDGARIWNAVAAAGADITDWTSQADTMMFCLSKGLGAPVGSVICGPGEAIREARRIQILFGGAWRQAGVVAAAGLVALERGRERLVDDHVRARRLADAIAEISPGAVDPAAVVTNMVFVDTRAVGLSTHETIARLASLGVGSVPIGGGMLRMVTHVDVDDDGIALAIDAWRSVAEASQPDRSVGVPSTKGDR
jgi:threonine aldolase